MVRSDHVDASDRGLRDTDRSRRPATSAATALLLAVVALGVSSCTRPEDATSADDTIAPVIETSSPDDPEADTEPAVFTTERSPTSTISSTTIPDGGRTSTTQRAGPTTTPTTTATTTRATRATTSTTPEGRPDEPSDLTLIFDGILPFRFGDRDIDVVPALTDILGPPTRDDLREYPVADEGFFLDATGEESFVARFGRTVCYTEGLCLQFGAGAPETLLFTGWRVDSASSELSTEDGVSIGSTLAEFADLITFDPALGCGQVVDGTAAGIDVTLRSDGGDFGSAAPDPAAITVIEMRAGQLPAPTRTGC